MPKTVASTTTKRYVSPAIGLDRPARKKLHKDECLTFKLRSNPADEQSTTYELTIPYFTSGTPEELLLFIKSVRKIFAGQNITDGPGRYAIMRRLLQGDALAAFDRAAANQGTETRDHLEAVIRDLKTHVFPRRALANQKRYMRRFLRKPRDLKIREFVTRLVEVNEYLNEFPPSEANQKLPTDELMDIAEFAVPATWQRTMVLHDFDPTNHTPTEFVEFCERLEFAEGNDPSATSALKERNSRTDSKNGFKGGLLRAKTSARGSTKRTGKYCHYHQTDSHDTNECKVMLDQAKRMRGMREASPRTNFSTKNKTWT
jgi:hypothetical protein